MPTGIHSRLAANEEMDTRLPFLSRARARRGSPIRASSSLSLSAPPREMRGISISGREGARWTEEQRLFSFPSFLFFLFCFPRCLSPSLSVFLPFHPKRRYIRPRVACMARRSLGFFFPRRRSQRSVRVPFSMQSSRVDLLACAAEKKGRKCARQPIRAVHANGNVAALVW